MGITCCITKPDGSIRYCIDYRQLHDVTLKDSYPLPHTQDCLESLREAKWFSTLDLQSGYWQIEMDQKDKEKLPLQVFMACFSSVACLLD